MTKRESEIIALITEGMAKEIASRLNVATSSHIMCITSQEMALRTRLQIAKKSHTVLQLIWYEATLVITRFCM
jgi:DNA-binding NarL/FixJ family response regulator